MLCRFNVAFNNFSVISQRYLVATGSSVLTFIVLPHWSIMPQTLDMIPHPVTLSWHWVNQTYLYLVSLSAKQGAASTIFNVLGMSRPGIKPVTFCFLKRTLYLHSYRGRYMYMDIEQVLYKEPFCVFKALLNKSFKGFFCVSQLSWLQWVVSSNSVGRPESLETTSWTPFIWVSSWNYGTYHICDQWRLMWACASAQSCQSLHCSHTWSMEVDKGSHHQESDI